MSVTWDIESLAGFHSRISANTAKLEDSFCGGTQEFLLLGD